jgi:5-methylcytosine-specific restriction enzyme B
VRGSSVKGQDLVKGQWLAEGFVSLAASELRPDALSLKPGRDGLRAFVDSDYDSGTSYDRKEELVDEFHSFLNVMRSGDLVATISDGQVYLGEVTGEAEQFASEAGRSNLRRPVAWQENAYDYDKLPDDLQQVLSTGRDVVQLTAVLDQLRALEAGVGHVGLGPDDEQTGSPAAGIQAAFGVRELELPDPDDALAKTLLIDRAWLQEVRDLLWDDKQIVLYGPPGTGKTYLAQHLAEYLSGRDPQRVKLVQFHPSYSYEDFFEGFRPREDSKSGEVAFRITAGPLRELATLASREGNRHIPHFLIIDELNRANLAKVFGELYFLLEYRKRTVRLTYSGDDFGLPPNLFIIGTMNTADRSIALVDTAMRRRFAFIELSPAEEPTRGLLHRWLAREHREPEPALLLDALNARIDDPDFKIGPSYLMKPGVYRDGGLERTWRTKILPLLEEHHYGEGIDVNRRYGLAALRRAISASPVPAVVEPDPSSPLEQDTTAPLATPDDGDPEASR